MVSNEVLMQLVQPCDLEWSHADEDERFAGYSHSCIAVSC